MIHLEIDRNRDTSLYQQILSELRQKILSGLLPEGYRLPSTRSLSESYGLSRNICTEAYEQLVSEGYLESRRGSGTFVSGGLGYFRPPAPLKEKKEHTQAAQTGPGWIHFKGGVPEMSRLPIEIWGRYLRKAALEARPEEYGYSAPEGVVRLREEIALLLQKQREIPCRAENIIVGAGSYQCLLLSASLFRERGMTMAVENPVYSALTRGFRQAKISFKAFGLDEKGLLMDEIAGDTECRAFSVTPSHHFPTGAGLVIQRRIQLIRLAEERDGYILENNYDGDLLLSGPPVPSMAMLSPERVIHSGTFSQSLFPSLRIGYLAVPDALIAPITRLKEEMGFDVNSLNQLALALFMKEGAFYRHIHRMRLIYQAKHKALLSLVEKILGEDYAPRGVPYGLYIVLPCPGELSTEEIKGRMNEARVAADFVSRHYIGTPEGPEGLILGFGNMEEGEMEEGLNRIKRVFGG